MHKIIFDFSMGEERTLEDSWIYRHWYGSGAAVIIMDIYPSAEAAVKDDFSLPMRRKMENLSKEKQEEMRKVFQEWWSFFDGHWDELHLQSCNRFCRQTQCGLGHSFCLCNWKL